MTSEQLAILMFAVPLTFFLVLIYRNLFGGDDAPDTCTCWPCTTPGMGATAYGLTHCAACCYGSLIEEYDPNCPVDDHAYWGRRQMGITESSEACTPTT